MAERGDSNPCWLLKTKNLAHSRFRTIRTKALVETRIEHASPIAPAGVSPKSSWISRPTRSSSIRPLNGPLRTRIQTFRPEGLLCRCYDFDEVFAENLRALGHAAGRGICST